ncbi:MAG TPA: DUF5667 domain-containing protein [bacterium]|nr:DUF5667 domain-containing protein [bacterium]
MPKIKIAAAVCALLIMTGAGVVVAADSAKPGDILYGIDRAWENTQIAFSRSHQAKARTYLAQADERLVELEAVTSESTAAHLIPTAYADDADTEVIANLLTDYEEALINAQNNAQVAVDTGEDAKELLETIAQTTLEHEATLARVYTQVPKQAQDAIEHAMQVGATKHQEALQNMGKEQQMQVQNQLQEQKGNVEQQLQQLHNQGANTPSFHDAAGEQEKEQNLNNGETESQEQEQNRNQNSESDEETDKQTEGYAEQEANNNAGETQSQEQEQNQNKADNNAQD